MPPVGKNKNMARLGSKNPKWKDGRSSDYRRRITKAKKGELVHHADGNKGNNKKGNFTVLKPGKAISAIGRHNKKHPEKGKKK